jgi:hypothetical protein
VATWDTFMLVQNIHKNAVSTSTNFSPVLANAEFLKTAVMNLKMAGK